MRRRQQNYPSTVIQVDVFRWGIIQRAQGEEPDLPVVLGRWTSRHKVLPVSMGPSRKDLSAVMAAILPNQFSVLSSAAWWCMGAADFAEAQQEKGKAETAGQMEMPQLNL